jgi:hypothetical protein
MLEKEFAHALKAMAGEPTDFVSCMKSQSSLHNFCCPARMWCLTFQGFAHVTFIRLDAVFDAVFLSTATF